MPNCYCATRKLPLDQLPQKQRVLGEKAIAEHDAQERETSESRGRKADGVVEEARRQLHELLGSKKLSTLREAMQKERMAQRSLREPPAGLSFDFEKANKARKKKIDALLGKLGVDPKQLRAISRATNAKLMKVLGTPAGSVTPGFNLNQNLAKWTKLSPLHKLPLDWGVRPDSPIVEPNQWQIFGPPFILWNLAFDRVESDNFVVQREFILFESSGALGNIATMDCNDAGSFDFAHAVVDTEVVFIYQAPATGRLEVIVDAMNTFGHHDLRIEDEWGWSSHWTNQHNYLSLNVFHPNITERSLSLMSNFYREGNDDHTYSERALTPGNHYYGHMLSNGVVQEGDTFFVGVGTRTFDITRANDVEVHSRSNFQWLIRSAEVRIVT